MATILLTWELGGGLGHLMNLRPIAAELLRRGHRVFAALRDLSQAREILGESGVVFLQAPFKHQRMQEIHPCCTFAHILHNIGFCNADELTTMAGAWRQLFDFVRPDLIVFDHSPTALLAARGFPARKALIGSGFFSPPDVSPLPNLRTWFSVDPARLQADESRVLENINTTLARSSQPPIRRVAELFAALDEDFLLTFAELDCYPHRRAVEYLGMWSAHMGDPPQWPPGMGRKVFGYLKPFPELHQLLHALSRLPNSTLIYAPGIDPKLRTQFQSEHLRYADGPVEMSRAARECDLAILNGTFASTTAMLLAGKPALHIPIFLEQATTARAVERLGAGICAPPNNPAAIIAGLRCLLALDEYVRSARKFAARYSGFDPDRQILRVIDRVEELAASNAASCDPKSSNDAP
jgi:hypothetical protein